MLSSGRPLRIGCGAGCANDRVEPAVQLVERGDLDYLVFECLAERTIAMAQQAKARDPHAGFDPLLRERMEAVLAACHGRGVTLITNMSNPRISPDGRWLAFDATTPGGLPTIAIAPSTRHPGAGVGVDPGLRVGQPSVLVT